MPYNNRQVTAGARNERREAVKKGGSCKTGSIKTVQKIGFSSIATGC